jgi:CRISPR system Cascade subunit CasC
MFLQIHTLTSYPASLLNRDDAGLAKRIPFGDAQRLRISSQCLKRHWREAMAGLLTDVPDGLRTRSFFTRAILPGLLEKGLPEEHALALIKALAQALIKGGVDDNADMSQPVLFGNREADYLTSMALQASEAAPDTKAAVKALEERLKSKEEKKNLEAMKKDAGLTACLFGRMVTSDLLARVDAPVHVAHAFTVHAANAEMDYFTVVDDLNREEETGAAHANQSELGAGVYYGYVAVDLPLLVSNLTGTEAKSWKAQDPALPRRVLRELIWVIASQSPGAKKGSTAPYSRAELVLLEAGTAQPRTLANAFLQAVSLHTDPMTQAVGRMADYLKRVDGMYGETAEVRTLATIHSAAAFAPLAPMSMDGAAGAILDALWS